MSEYESITCLKCLNTSYNPRDVREKYCGKCNIFHDNKDDYVLSAGRPRTAEMVRGVYLMTRDARDVLTEIKLSQMYTLTCGQAATLLLGGFKAADLGNYSWWLVFLPIGLEIIFRRAVDAILAWKKKKRWEDESA